MTKERSEKLRRELDRLGEQLGELQPEHDGDAYLNLQNSILLAANKLYANSNDDLALEAFLEICASSEWKTFDPKKGTLSAFFSERVKLRKSKILHQDFGGRYKKETGLVKDKERQVFIRHASLDAPIDDAEGASLGELQRDTSPTPEEEAALDDLSLRILILFMDLGKHLGGRANNPTRRNYFQMFFTNGVATALHEQEAPKVFRQRERDLFQALKIPFLDYFMAAACRTVDAIAATPTKSYGQIVEGRGSEETPLPLPNDVYTAYLDRVENYRAKASAVSQQKTAFSALSNLL